MKPSEPIPTLSQRCSGPQEFKGIAHRTAAPVGKSFNGSLWNPLPGFVPGVLRAGPKSFAKIIGGLDFSLLFDLCTSNKIGANRESQKRVVEPVAIWGPEPNTSHSVASTGMAPERRSVVGFWVYQLSYICLPQDCTTSSRHASTASSRQSEACLSSRTSFTPWRRPTCTRLCTLPSGET